MTAVLTALHVSLGAVSFHSPFSISCFLSHTVIKDLLLILCIHGYVCEYVHLCTHKCSQIPWI